MITRKKYYSNGNLECLQFHKGKKHCKEYLYFTTGTILSKREYIDDKLHGIVKVYNDDGMLCQESLYESGIRTQILQQR